MGKYTNSVGHLIMSVVCIVASLVLIIFSNDATSHSLGFSTVTIVTAFWFISGAKNSAIETKIIPPGNDTNQKQS